MLTHFHITQQGQSHVEADRPCDDYSDSRRIEFDGGQYVLAAVADGVGSCENSRFGSKQAVETALDYLSGKISELAETNSEEIAHKMLRRSFKRALQAIEALSQETSMPLDTLDTTLTVCIYDGEKLYFGHSGDDGAVALYTDGTYEMITKRIKGELSNSVYPLCEVDTWQFGVAPKQVAAFALMTDGVLDHVVDIPAPLNNRVFYPFIQPILAIPINDDAEAEEVKRSWEVLLGGRYPYRGKDFRHFVTDDISLVVVQNPELVKQLPEIKFDLDAWNKQTLEFNEKQKRSLGQLAALHVKATPNTEAENVGE